MNIKPSKVILGLDPGTNIMGFGLIKISNNKTEILQYGVFNFQKYDSHYEKLQKIYESVSSVIEDYKPDELAIEAPFFGKNVQSMLKLGRAQGVAIAAAIKFNLPVYEYAPKKIKNAVSGKGNASKELIAQMIEKYSGQKLESKFYDATDALAAAYCHFFQNNNTSLEKSTKSYKDWGSFLEANKDRIK